MAFTYNLPFQGFNPWASYNRPDENPTYNYTMDPYYNAAQDQQKWDLAQTGPNSEDNRSRVWRWTLDNLRAAGYDPGKAPTDVVNKFYLQNIGRLRNDYQASGFDWNRSGFSGYDKFMAQPQTTQPGGQRGQGGNDQLIQPKPPGSVSPGGGNNQGTGTVAPTGGNPAANGGQGLGNAASNAVLGAPQNADLAYQYMLRSIGWDPTVPSRFGDFLKQRFSPLLQADLAASAITGGGPGGSGYLDNIQRTINNFGQGMTNGDAFFANEAAKAQDVLGNPAALDYLGGIQDQQQVQQYLSQLATLQYAGANPMIQQSIADTLDRARQQYDYNAFQQLQAGQGQGDPYLTWLKNNPFYNRYLGVRFS